MNYKVKKGCHKFWPEKGLGLLKFRKRPKYIMYEVYFPESAMYIHGDNDQFDWNNSAYQKEESVEFHPRQNHRCLSIEQIKEAVSLHSYKEEKEARERLKAKRRLEKQKRRKLKKSG